LPRKLAGEIMAVVVKYVVERNGVERMTFTTKKEADAYDKMLDIAESLELMLEKVDVPLSEQQIESLALEIAKSKDDFMAVLKGAKDPVPAKVSEKSKKTDNVASIKNSDEKQVS
jgi:dsDNA-binding SOS-regulon protein